MLGDSNKACEDGREGSGELEVLWESMERLGERDLDEGKTEVLEVLGEAKKGELKWC